MRDAECPNCGVGLEIEQPETPPTPSPSKRKPYMSQVLFILFGFLFLIMSIASCSEMRVMDKSFRPNSGYSNRFKTDITHGASANALEYIAENYPSTSNAPWLICALICWLIAAVERLRGTIIQEKQQNKENL